MMMSQMFAETALLAFLILLNGLLAMSELAVVSARKWMLSKRAGQGHRGAKTALELAEAPTRFLATVQIGITMVGVSTGVLGGATLARGISARLAGNPWVGPYSDAIGLAVVVVVITYFSLIFGELVPKRIALAYPEGVAGLMSVPLRALSRAAFPAVKIMTASTDAVLKAFRVTSQDSSIPSEEEIRVMLEQGTRRGVFDEFERDLVERVFELDDRRVSAIMTPRTHIVWLDLADPPETLRAKLEDCNFSHFPVAEGSIEAVKGLVRARDLLLKTLHGEPLDLEACLLPPLFVPEGMSALDVLQEMRSRKSSIALVVDEYGGLEGIVSFTDLMEAVIGDIPLARNLSAPQATQREDGSWLMDGSMLPEQVKEILGITVLPGEDTGRFNTLGGFCATEIKRIPTAGEHFTTVGWRFEIADMDGRRIDKVLVSRADAPTP